LRSAALVLAACYIVAGPSMCAQTDSAAPKDAAGSKDAVPAHAYEIVSIKPDKSGNGGGTQMLPDGDRWTNFPLVLLIRGAYGVSMENQIEGLPGWAQSENYDIEVKADAETVEAWKKLSYKERWKKEQPMMQAMLADRCQLKLHRQTREMPVYDLVIAKGGLKMKEAAADEANYEMLSGNKMTAHAQTTDSLVAFEGSVGRMIVDKTGLEGKKFDFELTWAPDDRRGGDQPTDAGPSIFTALEEELGLKLVPAKRPVEVLIIDHIVRPSPN
jgi:uncharacterized protein (TIGR03435 family)